MLLDRRTLIEKPSTGSGSNLGWYPEGPWGENKGDQCSLSLCACEKDEHGQLCYTKPKSPNSATVHKNHCSIEEQGKCVLSKTAEHKYTEIQWEIQFLLNTLRLEVQVIDALIAQLLMCPFLHLQGEPQVNVAWTVSVHFVCLCIRGKREYIISR